MKKLLLLCAALSVFSATAQDAVKVGYISFVAHAPNFLAKERGYFAENGLEAELVRFQSAQQMAVAIASGDVDYGVTAVTGGLLNLAVRGDAIRIFGGSLREDSTVEGQLIIASNQAYAAGLTTPEALAGKRWAVTTTGSSYSYMGEQIAAAVGIDPKSLTMVPLNSVPTIVASLSTGQVDAWAMQPNTANRLIAQGDAKLIGKVADYLPDYQVTVLFTATKNVEQHPEQVRGFKRAFARGIADYNAALVDKTAEAAEVDAVVEIIRQYVYQDEPADKAREMILQGNMRLSPGAALNKADVIRQMEWFAASGDVPSLPDAEKIITVDATEAAQ